MPNPHADGKTVTPPARPGSVRDRFRRFLDGPDIHDPLYLTNRSLGQRVRLGLLVGTPVVIVCTLVALAVSNKIAKNTAPPVEVSAAEIAARSMPELNQSLKVPMNTDLQVEQAAVEPVSPPYVSGTMRNTSDRRYPYARAIFDLADATGSEIGTVSAELHDLAPHSVVKFRFPIQQTGAVFVLLREIATDREEP
jgi:hypothetical protein